MSISATQIKRSIESFLQLNNLTQTLHIFKNQQASIKQRSKGSQISQNMIQKQKGSQKQIICVNKKQAYQLHKLSTQKIYFDNPQTEGQLRQYFQKTQIKLLKKVFERIKKSTKNNNNQQNRRKSQQPTKSPSSVTVPLTSTKFFNNLLAKQLHKFQSLKQQKNQTRSCNPFLQQSIQYENQWLNFNQLGYQINEFYTKQFPQVIRQLKAIKQINVDEIIKYCPIPQNYLKQIQQYKERNNINIHDRMYSKLPGHVKFKIEDEQNNKNKNKNDSLYPLEIDNVVYDSYYLKVIYDRYKTGFEDQRDIKIVINQVLAGKYQIISNLGSAQFSNAIQVKDLTNQKRYCLKIIQNNKQYFDQSLDEIKILNYIKSNCNPDQHYLLNLHDYFYHKQHLMLLTQLLKDTLLHAYQQNRQMFTNLRNIQIFTRQILIALQKLHELHIIHTDLKPENILIKSYTNKTLKVIDLGSSTFFHDQPSYYISTRSYRAPEIILGVPYDGRIDIWSLGCIVAEMYTGEVLFNAESSASLLALIQGLRGPWPQWMIQHGKNVHTFFTKEMFIYEDLKEETNSNPNSEMSSNSRSRIYTPKMTNMRSRIQSDNKNFLDFISKCLKIDPSQRMTASKALSHPFITETILE